MPEDMSEKMPRRRQNAVICLICAVVLAGILLGATEMALLDILRGPQEMESLRSGGAGDYVAMDIADIYDFYAEDYVASKDTVTAWYAVISLDGQLVTLRLPERYFDSAEVIIEDTYDELNGFIEKSSRYFRINGTVGELSEAAETKLYDWFSYNSEWMAYLGIVDSAEDYSDCLSPYVINVDFIGPYGYVTTYILTGIALAALVFALVIAFRLALGGYREKGSDADDMHCEHGTPAEEPWLKEDTDISAYQHRDGDETAPEDEETEPTEGDDEA